jgi:hypothetical protein
VLLDDAQALEGDLADALQLRRLGDLDIRRHVQVSRKLREFSQHAERNGLD